jgi:hypothetical protein
MMKIILPGISAPEKPDEFVDVVTRNQLWFVEQKYGLVIASCKKKVIVNIVYRLCRGINSGWSKRNIDS